MRRCQNISVILFILASVSCLPAWADEVDSGAPLRPFDEEIRFIEDLRGVAFPEEVTHREIRRAELKAFLRSIFARDLSISAQDYFEVLRALHLIDREPDDPFEVLLDLYVGQVLAFYDPVEDVFYSIDAAPENVAALVTEAFERAITIHELVHALQDQRFGAGERLSEIVGNWDRSLAYHALIEGEATLVMLAVLIEQLGGSLDDALADDQIVAALAHAAAIEVAGDETPPYFVESLKFPYVEGLSYVIDLYREGGWEALDRAHRDPPLSTEEIYGRENPGPVSSIGLDEALIETTLGEFHWRFLLGRETADGWESDRVAILRGNGGLNVLAVTRWDSKKAAGRFAEDYERFLREAGREPLVHVDRDSVTVVYGPDRDLSRRLMERRLKRELAGETEEIEHR